jgi:hypothetical protein
LIYPGVEFKSVEGDALPPDANFNEIRPYLGVETVAVHTQVARYIAEADQSRRDTAVLFQEGLCCVECLPVVDHSVCVFRKLARKLTLGVPISSSFREQTDGKLWFSQTSIGEHKRCKIQIMPRWRR